ncbi:uncharacterized protein METZ01_LOCUS458782, partial [marine metagenome]
MPAVPNKKISQFLILAEALRRLTSLNEHSLSSDYKIFRRRQNPCWACAQKNEDSFFCDAENCIYAVADGLGGLPFGDLASKAVVQYIKLWTNARRSENREGIDWPTFMKEINHRVIQTGQISAHGLGVGTTLSLEMIRNNTLEVSHIGDSRIYLLRNERFEQLTTDHTLETFAREQNRFLTKRMF